MNFLLRTDSYKFTHWKQYPPQTTRIYSYLESRGGMFPNTVFFGLQYYLKQYLEGPRFTPADIDEADEFCRQHFGSLLFIPGHRPGEEFEARTAGADRVAARPVPHD